MICLCTWTDVAQEQANFEETLNRNYFEENNGLAHLQVLETLSTEYAAKSLKEEPQLEADQRKQYNGSIPDPLWTHRYRDGTQVEGIGRI